MLSDEKWRVTKPRKERFKNITGLPKRQRGFLFKELVMTFKKFNRSAQAIFEYFILTIAVVAIVLFFSNSSFFQTVRNQCNTAFSDATEEILR